MKPFKNVFGSSGFNHIGTLLNQKINLVVEGHSFMTQARGVDNYIAGSVNCVGYYNSAVDGSSITAITARQATVNSKLSTAPNVKNILAVWIGVNDISGGTVGSGATAYNAFKAYAQTELAVGWKILAFTCTSTNKKGDAAQFEIERLSFNNLLRTDLALLNNVHILDTDTVLELADYTNVLFFSDNLHLTWAGSCLAGELFKAKMVQLYGNKALPIPITTSLVDWTITASDNGSVLATLEIIVSERMQLRLVGGAKFYMNLEGTVGESDIWVVSPSSSALRKIYIKCTEGTSILMIEKNKISQLRTWTSPTNAPVLGGVITPLNILTRIAVQNKNTITGSCSDFQYLDLFDISLNGNNFFPTGTASPTICYLIINSLITLTTENVNKIVADIWASKDVPKNFALRNIDARGSATSGAPTGQGLIDKANLQAYRSPNMEADKSLWTILTR